MIQHNHYVASNSAECLQECVNHHILGVLFDALSSYGAGTKTFVLDCGWGLTFASNGAYWLDPPDTIRQAIQTTHRKLRQTERDIAATLALAGLVATKEE